MKKILLFIFLICSLPIFASIKYVATTGSDANDGSKATPYLSVKYGVTHSTDTCYINAGTYTLANTQILVPVGVKIVGADSSNTIIDCRYTTSGSFGLWSASATIGNNSFYNLKFEGGGIAYAALYVTRRSNVTINRCVVKNFNNSAITVTDAVDGDSPGISGIIVKNSQLINSSSYYAPGSGGIIWIRGTKDGEISNNIITASYRTGDSAGFCLKMSHLKNYKIFNNSIKVINHDDASKWIFAAELNHILGGIEVYDNIIEGIFDVAGKHCQKGSYNYSLSFHDNLFGTSTLTSMYKYGIELENVPDAVGLDMSDVLIYNNTFRNLSRAIISIYYPQTIMQRIRIYNNLFYGIGWTKAGTEGKVIDWMGSGSATIRDIYIDNNTMVAAIGGTQATGINLPARNCKTHNYRIRNNIIVGFDHSAIETGNMYPNGTIDSLYIQNNNFYQNGYSNNPWWYGITPSHIIPPSPVIIKSDPQFISTSDFRLQATSPMIDAGINVGLTIDITGYPIIGTPDIGAFKYYPSSPNGKVGLYNGKAGTYNN